MERLRHLVPVATVLITGTCLVIFGCVLINDQFYSEPPQTVTTTITQGDITTTIVAISPSTSTGVQTTIGDHSEINLGRPVAGAVDAKQSQQTHSGRPVAAEASRGAQVSSKGISFTTTYIGMLVAFMGACLQIIALFTPALYSRLRHSSSADPKATSSTGAPDR